ncbi:DNA topoisomerase 3-alpha [Chironomus tepperi]|uniref:DNA topoisomerase 3-alpha n=1 Tax=Chironomus tepperi TaxID=113505 RepID=UPI00391FBB06
MLFRILNGVRHFSRSLWYYDKMKYLCVAEKNDAAKTISSILSNGHSDRREGYSQFNKIYEFEMDVRGQNSKIVFTSVSGHLLNREFTGIHRKWLSCNPEELFHAQILKYCPERYENIKRTLEREVRSCNGLIIWTDCDREGENIGYEIIEVCRAIKPGIQVYRAKFSDMTAPSLRRAMTNLSAPDERISQAVEVRSELDLRIGAAFTRFQTLRLKNLFPQNISQDDLVSYGSCQIPTLGFVVERYNEIETFIASNFWKIKLTHRMNNLTVEYNWARNRLFDKQCCEAILMLCKAENLAVITNVHQKPKSKWRPQAMDTVELEKTGSRKLRITAKEIMTIAEKLYTQGFISYPRTETNKFSPDLKLRPLVEMQAQHPDWGEFANRVLEWGPNPRNGTKSDQAHPPIHPTKFTNSLSGNEKRVYELIVRHFLACVSRDAVGSETIVNATVGDEEFNATGLVILERNYLDVYIYEKWTGKEIHRYDIGNTFVPTVLDLHEGKTSPPSLLTEADLIALMEKHGIGTDATHAEHISTIKDRGYIGEVDRGHLVPGILGMGLVEGYKLMKLTLSQPELRAGLEVDLKAICEGRKDPNEVLQQQIEIYKNCYRTITREVALLDRAVGNRFGVQPDNNAQPLQITSIHKLFKCPKCQTEAVIIRKKKDNTGSFFSCQGYPTCKHAIWLSMNVKDVTSLDEKCTNCNNENHKIKIKFSQPYMLSQVDEVPAYSRIENGHYITCIYCDSKAREVLQIKTEDVKHLGNVVGASTRPVVQRNQVISNNPPRNNNSTLTNNPPRNNNSNPQGSRNFGTSAGNNTNNRPWNDRNRNSGSSSNNNSNNNRRGWQDSSNSSGSNNNSNNNQQQGFGNLFQNFSNNNNQNNNYGNSQNQRRNWFNNDSNGNRGDADDRRREKDTLNSLPNIMCGCQTVALKLIVKKDGPNKSRPFYKCNGDKCKFFQWGDVPLPPNVQAMQAGGSGGSERGTKKCGICRQTGHNRKNCPNAPNH